MKKILTILMACTGFYSVSLAQLIIERPEVEELELSYFIYPIAYTVPGVGTGTGVGASLLYGDFNFTVAQIRGTWDFDSILLKDIPLFFTQQVTLSFAWAHLRNGKFTLYDRGIDSAEEPLLDVELEDSRATGLELSFYFLQRQVQLYTGYSVNVIKIKEFHEREVDDFETTYLQQANILKINDVYKPVIVRYGLRWDNTDDPIDRREGFDLRYEQYSSLFDFIMTFKIHDYSLSYYLPFEGKRSVLATNLFYSRSESSTKGDFLFTRSQEGDRNECVLKVLAGEEDNYDSSVLTPEEFCSIPDAGIDHYLRFERQNPVGATTLGGSSRLRSYPVSRFWDTHSAYFGVEYRWYFAENAFDFNWIIERGLFKAMQLAIFWDTGSVSPDGNFDKFKDSVGVGYRIVLGGVILRMDYATGSEGDQFIAFFGHPF